jgi:succinate dehydrogenase / fumarate reductase, cytochrome b subunit
MISALNFLSSSIGRKVIMSLTGLFICLFLIIHLSGNLQLFRNDAGLQFNQYTVFMTTFLPVKIISYILYISIVLHAISGLRLWYLNVKARPVGYKSRKDPRSSTWASKNMGLLGTIVLVFLTTHMANFWYAYKFGNVPWMEYRIDPKTGSVLSVTPVGESDEVNEPFEYLATDANGNEVQVAVMKNLYAVVDEAFDQSWLVALYLIGMIALAYHLVHGFQSAFQTMGWRHNTYTPLVKGIGIWIFGIIIPLLFATMPVYFFFFK